MYILGIVFEDAEAFLSMSDRIEAQIDNEVAVQDACQTES